MMALGPGKYDDVADVIWGVTDAKALVLMVADGNQGSGFAVKGSLALIAGLPTLLRRAADEIERDLARIENSKGRPPVGED